MPLELGSEKQLDLSSIIYPVRNTPLTKTLSRNFLQQATLPCCQAGRSASGSQIPRVPPPIPAHRRSDVQFGGLKVFLGQIFDRAQVPVSIGATGMIHDQEGDIHL